MPADGDPRWADQVVAQPVAGPERLGHDAVLLGVVHWVDAHRLGLVGIECLAVGDDRVVTDRLVLETLANAILKNLINR